MFAYIKGFFDFIKERGILGLAIGFVLAGQITQVVSAFLTDLLNPFLGLILGSTKGLENAYLPFFKTKIMYGHFLSVLLNFLAMLVLVYVAMKILGLEEWEKQKKKK